MAKLHSAKHVITYTNCICPNWPWVTLHFYPKCKAGVGIHYSWVGGIQKLGAINSAAFRGAEGICNCVYTGLVYGYCVCVCDP